MRRAIGRIAVAIILIVVIVVASATAYVALVYLPSSSQSANYGLPASVKSAIDAEGDEVDVVGGPPSFWSDAVFHAFQVKYPFIKVVFTRLAAGDLLGRLQAEKVQGKITFDVAIVPTPSPVFSFFVQNGYFTPYNSPSYATWPSQYITQGPNGDLAFAAGIFTCSALIYNTNLVPSDKVPNSYMNLTQPFWNGKISLNDPRADGTTWYTYVIDIWNPYGAAAFKGIAANNPFLSSTVAQYIPQVIAGQKLAAQTCDVFAYPSLINGTAPVGISYLKEGVIVSTWQTGILAGAPHPAAAKVFVDWLASMEGQQVVVQKGLHWSAIYKGIPGNNTKLPSLFNQKLIILTPSQEAQIDSQFATNSTLGQIEKAMGLPSS